MMPIILHAKHPSRMSAKIKEKGLGNDSRRELSARPPFVVIRIIPFPELEFAPFRTTGKSPRDDTCARGLKKSLNKVYKVKFSAST
jgi:hypothetical protein